jgi:hypothetical protein
MYWTNYRYLFYHTQTEIVCIKDSIHERELATFILQTLRYGIKKYSKELSTNDPKQKTTITPTKLL